MAQAVQIFIAYARKDSALLDEFRVHLRPLERADKLRIWYDGLIEPGAEWEASIKQNLHAADIILLLVSADAIASDYFYDKEVADALERHRKGSARVVPMIVRPCAWTTTPLAGLQALPKDGKPVTSWSDRDEAFTYAAEALWDMAHSIQQQREEKTEQARREKEDAEETRRAAQQAKEEQVRRAEQERLQRAEEEKRRKEVEAAKALKAEQERLERAEEDKRSKEAEAAKARKAEQERLQRAEEDKQRKEAEARRQPVPPSPPYLRWTTMAAGAVLIIFMIVKIAGGSGDEKTPLSTATATAIAQPDLVLIPGGTFNMGCTPEQKDCHDDEKTVTRVTVDDFYLGKYEVTFDEYDAFCAATGREKPSDLDWGRGQRPVINVSWNDAVAYCNWLSEQQNLAKVYTISGDQVSADWSATGYRLPTEAEWEYAARGGVKAALFGNGKNVADPKEINFDGSAAYKKDYSVAGESHDKTVPVGSLNSPNALGLHDMSGNVLEWCWDWYAPYPGGNKNNYRGPASGSVRVCRGGSWYYSPQLVRVAVRYSVTPDDRGSFLGFRLARAVR